MHVALVLFGRALLLGLGVLRLRHSPHLHAVYHNARPTAAMVVRVCIAKKIRIAKRRVRLASKIVSLATKSSLEVVGEDPPLIHLVSEVAAGPILNHGMRVMAAANVASPSATAVSIRRAR
jgi:hypothetical protein